ncbi:MAG: hypothetical protein HC922_11650 [Leptolyngbyaceae cyanobacterium SM2_3_12]|nr:hypothetical protein [Leptolyngbyaceae cyanobacterium SM2_3_12]
MANTPPLQGIELVDCAKSCAKQGLHVAAAQCGYGDDTEQFLRHLREACQNLGIHVNSLEDLITEQQQVEQQGGLEIAPDSPDSL